MEQSKLETILTDLNDVLDRHGARLFFPAPAELYADGDRLAAVVNDDGGDDLLTSAPNAQAELPTRRGGQVD